MTPRIIVITGVTRGLGRALARSLARAGHTVAGCGRGAAALDELGTELGPPHRLDRVDVAHDAAVAAWAARVLAALGPPDLLVNNAALMNAPAPLWRVPATEMAVMLAVNVAGTVNVIRHFAPAMIERGRGVIVNISSGWGRSADAEVGPYCATKWAIEGLTRSLAAELPPGLAAVPLNPGVVDTDMLRQCWADEAGAYEDAETWARRAAPYLLRLGPSDSGRPRTVP